MSIVCTRQQRISVFEKWSNLNFFAGSTKKFTSVVFERKYQIDKIKDVVCLLKIKRIVIC